jgi:ATP-dependent Lhr-like helicase
VTSEEWRRKMPDAWRIFFRERTPRPIQDAAMLPILTGQSVLLCSPTASGKSEAALAPLYQRHVSFQRTAVSVLYVAPTKALVNDMLARLLDYFGSSSADIVKRYTGDRHEFDDPTAAFALLCSPEALDSLQLTRSNALQHVRAVVFDELHFLHGTARGQQARAVLDRIRKAALPPADSRDSFQVVAMTATLDDPEAVARHWIGLGAQVLSVQGSRSIDFHFVDTQGARTASAIFTAIQSQRQKKLLVFANTRNRAHALAAELSPLLAAINMPVYLHIGILAPDERESVESAMRNEKRAICVATTTLELGIDIGDVDAVVLAEPPLSINAFLQRIGRGNRRADKCIVWGMFANSAEREVLSALLHCVDRGLLDELHEYSRPSIEFQQTLSLAWIGTREDRPLRRDAISYMTSQISTAVVDDMIDSGVLEQVGNAVVPSDYWMDEGDKRRIHSIIAGGAGLPIVDLHSGETIGFYGLGPIGVGNVFLGSKVKEIRASDASGIYLGPSGTKSAGLAKLPSSSGRRLGMSRRLVWALAEVRELDPRVWQYRNSILTTWGGGPYNLLLKEALQALALASDLTSDSFTIGRLAHLPWSDPRELRSLVELAVTERRLPLRVANAFRESTRYFRFLGKAMQREECYRSVPIAGCLAWLGQCRSIVRS